MFAKKIIIEENHPKNVQVSSVCNYVINYWLSSKEWDMFFSSEVIFRPKSELCVIAANYFCYSTRSCSKRTLLGMLSKERKIILDGSTVRRST